MTKEQLQAFREAVEASIEYAIVGREEDSEGYRVSAVNERKAADAAWMKLAELLEHE